MREHLQHNHRSLSFEDAARRLAKSLRVSYCIGDIPVVQVANGDFSQGNSLHAHRLSIATHVSDEHACAIRPNGGNGCNEERRAGLGRQQRSRSTLSQVQKHVVCGIYSQRTIREGTSR
jgi:hypothetical protein